MKENDKLTAQVNLEGFDAVKQEIFRAQFIFYEGAE